MPPADFITEQIRPKTPASIGGGFQRAVKSSMDSANIQRGLNPPLNEVSFKPVGNFWLKPKRTWAIISFFLRNHDIIIGVRILVNKEG